MFYLINNEFIALKYINYYYNLIFFIPFIQYILKKILNIEIKYFIYKILYLISNIFNYITKTLSKKKKNCNKWLLKILFIYLTFLEVIIIIIIIIINNNNNNNKKKYL